jgi:MFS family permease
LFGSRRIGTGSALAGAAAAAALGLAASGHGAGAVLFGLTAIAGASLNGMQAYLYAVSAHSYPTLIRGTGMGAAAAVARLGGVLSSALGSYVFAAGLAASQFFLIIGAIILATAISFFLLRSHIPSRSRFKFRHR